MKWKDRTAAGKAILILSVLLSAAAVTMPLLYGLRIWQGGLTAGILLLGLREICQAALQWKTERKLAWLSLGTGIFVLGCSIAVILL